MVAVAAKASAKHLAWTFVEDEDRHGAPVRKVFVRYVAADGRTRYQKYSYGYEDGEAYIKRAGVGLMQPSRSDMSTLLEDMQAHYRDEHTDYYVDDVNEVQS